MTCKVSQQSCHALSTHQTPDFTELKTKRSGNFRETPAGIFIWRFAFHLEENFLSVFKTGESFTIRLEENYWSSQDPELNKNSVNFTWFSYKQVQYIDNSLKIYQQSKNIMLFEHIAGFLSPFLQILTMPVD